MGEPAPQITFAIRLAEGDWDEEMRGWRCPVLNVPGSLVDELYLEGTRVDKAKYEILQSYSMIRWSSNKKPERILATIKLTRQLSLDSDTERWKKLAIILPFIATIVSAIISGVATYIVQQKPPKPADQTEVIPSSQASRFQPLGFVLGFGVSIVYKISTDGKVVVGDVGQTARENIFPAGAMRWSAPTGMVYLGTPDNGPGETEALGVSADGSVVVGYYGYGGNCAPNKPWRWTATTGMVALVSTVSSMAYDANANGTVVVGSFTPCNDNQPGNNQAAIYTDAGGWTSLGTLPGNDSSAAYGVSADGTVVVGDSCSKACQAFRWTLQQGMIGLGVLPGASSSNAMRVSSDGTTTVGSSTDGNGKLQAFRWTAADGMKPIGYLFGATSSVATHVNADGSVVVGHSGEKAFRWTASNGMQSIEKLLSDDGVALSGWKLQDARGVSGDGTVVAGTGINPKGLKEAWIATFPSPK